MTNQEIEQALTLHTQEIGEIRAILLEVAHQQQVNTTAITGLREEVRDAVQMVLDLGEYVREQAEQAEQDRSQAAIDRAEFRSTVNDILAYLRHQQNGNGGG